MFKNIIRVQEFNTQEAWFLQLGEYDKPFGLIPVSLKIGEKKNLIFSPIFFMRYTNL